MNVKDLAALELPSKLKSVESVPGYFLCCGIRLDTCFKLRCSPRNFDRRMRVLQKLSDEISLLERQYDNHLITFCRVNLSAVGISIPYLCRIGR